MGKYFTRSIRSLPAVFNYLDAFLKKYEIDEDVSFAMRLAVEEIFTNLVKYHKDNPHRIRVALSQAPGTLIVRIYDFDVASFDITQKQTERHTLPLKKRQPGGLGLHLVKKITDDIQYKYDAQKRQCEITLIKYWGKTNVQHRHRQQR